MRIMRLGPTQFAKAAGFSKATWLAENGEEAGLRAATPETPPSTVGKIVRPSPTVPVATYGDLGIF